MPSRAAAPRPPSPPRLPPALERASLPAGAARDETRWTAVELEGASLAGVEARSLEFEETRLVGCDLSGARLSRFGLLDCELVRCNLANVVARDASMARVACSDSRLTGFQWPEGGVRDLLLRDCRADLASFRFATLQRATFAGCVLRDADFQGARLESVRFLDCDLTGASFADARFERSELRGCRLEGLRGVEGLGGAALEWSEIIELAGTFAAALGVRLIDDEAQPDGAA